MYKNNWSNMKKIVKWLDENNEYKNDCKFTFAM